MLFSLCWVFLVCVLGPQTSANSLLKNPVFLVLGSEIQVIAAL